MNTRLKDDQMDHEDTDRLDAEISKWLGLETEDYNPRIRDLIVKGMQAEEDERKGARLRAEAQMNQNQG